MAMKSSTLELKHLWKDIMIDLVGNLHYFIQSLAEMILYWHCFKHHKQAQITALDIAQNLRYQKGP